MLTINTSGIDELLKTLKLVPRELEKVSTRAINKSLTSTRAYMVKAVREDYDIKAKDVRSSLGIKRANWLTLSGHVRGSGSPGIPLLSFVKGRKKIPSTRRLKSGGYRPKGGVPVIILKSRGRRIARGVFLARMKSGHKGAFKRTGVKFRGSKEQIKEAYGPSPILILSGEKHDKQIEKFAGDTLQKNLLHEADRSLKKIGLR